MAFGVHSSKRAAGGTEGGGGDGGDGGGGGATTSTYYPLTHSYLLPHPSAPYAVPLHPRGQRGKGQLTR